MRLLPETAAADARSWPTFQTLAQKDQKTQTAVLNDLFPKGKTLALTFAASKETFPETRRNFLAALARQLRAKVALGKRVLVRWRRCDICAYIDQQKKQILDARALSN